MLRRLKGHKDVILEAGGENYYPAKGAAPISTLLVLIVTQVLARCIRRLNAPYNFAGARREPIPVGLQTSSMKFALRASANAVQIRSRRICLFGIHAKDVPRKVYSAFTASFTIVPPKAYFRDAPPVFVKPLAAVEFS